ncbi:class I mannose-6-phosphate isomerase [Cohnella phaseoli]|uniref:Mannose-6-phosphate isomerase class I n=1 Tax=Cohnella phaseoli TaxID=456490 RepID=A0A3D9JNT6_9BACL|nr:class I mannose-6-phosphate isomerase [Cohnella phaseoli]RED75674.1 mannose-6-phosphate isomerase class I [Cohnella phaseoli]
MSSNANNKKSYNLTPTVPIKDWDQYVWQSYDQIASELQDRISRSPRRKTVLVVECYPTVRQEEIIQALQSRLNLTKVIRSEQAAMPGEQIKALIQRYLTDDRVFGYMSPCTVDEFYSRELLQDLKNEADTVEDGLVVVIGFGASLVAEGDILVYADIARWEIQQRYRSKEFGNWRLDNREEETLRKYKAGFFFEWRMADRLKRQLFSRIDYYLDTNAKDDPKMVTWDALMAGLRQTASQPFRLVPYFDPGVWGGKWLEEKIDLPPRENPYAWGFDGVPEENSLYFQYGSVRMELPSINLVFFQPRELLGDRVYARFGAEFPIRFDLLDTIGGGNLSLQVHPTTDYIRSTFGMNYTQDESYYILDSKPGALVYLGLREDADGEAMLRELQLAQEGEISFPAEQYVNTYAANKHDHFLIPAGTIHCSASDCMVLEISATPYIFTFKLWDWGQIGLDGKPRPVHLEHGEKVIQWDRTTSWVEKQLVNSIVQVGGGAGWREERTGLHEFQFIETRRHWFSEPVLHEANGSVHMLNLVEGEEAVVESPSGEFEPFVVRYAETFIVPASVSSYTIRPSGPSEGGKIATIKAYVRS